MLCPYPSVAANHLFHLCATKVSSLCFPAFFLQPPGRGHEENVSKSSTEFGAFKVF